MNNIPLEIKEASIQNEEAITKEFYSDYSTFKKELFIDLVELNMKNEVFRSDLNIEDLSDRASDVLSRDYRRLRTIQEQLALTIEVMNQ